MPPRQMALQQHHPRSDTASGPNHHRGEDGEFIVDNVQPERMITHRFAALHYAATYMLPLLLLYAA